MYKPILIPTDNKHSGLDIDPQNNNRLSIESKQYFHKNPQQVILIDTKAKVDEGDLVYRFEDNLIFKSNHPYSGDLHKGLIAKIISSTNNSHKLPQLSVNSIQLLIDYYNEFRCMPESVEVNEEFKYSTTGKRNDGLGKYIIKLNQQGKVDTTISEKQLYQQIIDICGGEAGFCKTANIAISEVEETTLDAFDRGFTAGHNAGVKLSIAGVKEKSYTKKEVIALIKKHRQETYNGYSSSKWIKENIV